MARTDPTIYMRVPQELKDKLDAASEENRRSLTAEVVARLEASFAQHADAEFHSAGKPPQFAGGGPATGPGLPPALLAALERLFDEKLGQRAYIDDGKGGRMEDVKIVKKKG